jgi:hypothetical protein
MAPGRGGARLVRVALFSLTAVTLAYLAHRAGGGAASPVHALTPLPVVMLVMNLLAGRRQSFWVLLAAMGLLQAGLHYAFMATSLAPDCHVAAATQHGASGASHGMSMHCTPEMSHSTFTGTSLSSTMTLVHALAANLLVLIRARGESAIWALADVLGFCSLLMCWRPQIPAVRLSRPNLYRPIRTPRRAVRFSVLRRGPPALVCAAF